MQLIFKFKDGATATQDWDNNMSKIAKDNIQDLIKYLEIGKQKNSTITIQGKEEQVLERKYEDLYSIEIVI